MLRPLKFRGGARLVVVFEKTGELVLVIGAGEQMIANRPHMVVPQAIVEPLVVAPMLALIGCTPPSQMADLAAADSAARTRDGPGEGWRHVYRHALSGPGARLHIQC